MTRMQLMPQLLIRNLQEHTVENLKQRAKANHRSLQSEVALILENAANIQPENFWADAHQMRQQLLKSAKIFLDSTQLIREDRNR